MCLLEDLETRVHGLPFRIICTVIAVLVLLLIFISPCWWLAKRKSLIYLRKRSFSTVILISIGTLSVVLVGRLTRVTERENQFNNNCFLSNFFAVSINSFSVVGSLLSVLHFRWRVEYTKRLAAADTNSTVPFLWKWSTKSNFFVVTGLISGFLVTMLSVTVSISVCPVFTDRCRFFEFGDYSILIPTLFFAVLAIFQVLYIKQKLKSYPDPFGILREVYKAYIYTAILGIPLLVIGLIVETQYLDQVKENEEILLDGGIFIDIPLYFFYIYLIPYQIYKAYHFNELTAVYEDITLEKVLNDKTGHDLLKKHLISEFSVENIIFIDAVRTLRNYSEQLLSDSSLRNLYLKFIKQRILNLSSEIYRNLDLSFNSDVLTLSSFDDAYDDVLDTLRLDSFTRFKQSHEFMSYAGMFLDDEPLGEQE